MNDRDALIRLAIAPPVDTIAPAGLADAIHDEVVLTPQRRGLVRFGRFGYLPAPSPAVLALIALSLLGVALLIAALARPPAPVLTMYHGGPDRTGVMPGPGPVGAPMVLWDVSRPGPLPFTTMPIPVGDKVIVADQSGILAALDAATGATIWEVDVGAAVHGTPTVAGDLVLIGTDAGEVVATSLSRATIAWRAPLGDSAVEASLLVADGTVFAGTVNGTLFALSAVDGTVQWSVPVGAEVNRPPSIADGTLYIGTHAGTLSAIDVATHAVRWQVTLSPGDVGTPSIQDGRVYVAAGLHGPTSDHPLLALDAATGRIVWSFSTPTGEQAHPGALTHGRVYAAGEDGNLYAFDAATGQALWTSTIGGRLGTLASVVGDVLYVSTSSRSVHAIDAATGRELWVVDVVGEPTSAAVFGGRVFVGTALGHVVAIGGSTP